MLNRIIRVDMLKEEINEKPVPKEYHSLGGRGLTSSILSNEVNPKCDPLGPANKLIIAPGLFGGTIIPNCERLSIGGKSPLTGGIKESNVGGMAGTTLSQHGIKAVIIENASHSGVKYLEIKEDGIVLHDLKRDPYLGNYDLTDVFHQEYGKDVCIVSVGPAGMRKRHNASIAVSDLEKRPTRAAGRGGLGALMGSKGLKAIVIHPSKRPKAKPEDRFKEAVKVFSKSISENPAVGLLHGLGTAGVIDLACMMGSFPSYSFTKGKFDGFEKINGSKIVELQKDRGGKTGHRCMPGCIVACSNVYHDKDGRHVTSALEYETLCLLGSNLGIDDIEAIANFDRACDDTGVDTIESGGTFGVAMDEGKIKYGDSERVLKLISEMGKDSREGDLYGNGVVHLAKEIGAKRVPATLGQGHPGHDPRTLHGVGVTYATSPMGADHTAGLVFDPAKENAIALSRETQIYALLCDTFGLCIFVSQTVNDLAKVYSAFMNLEATPDDLRSLALRLLRKEVDFNESAGVPPIEERVSKIFREERLPETGNLFDTSYEEMKKIFD